MSYKNFNALLERVKYQQQLQAAPVLEDIAQPVSANVNVTTITTTTLTITRSSPESPTYTIDYTLPFSPGTMATKNAAANVTNLALTVSAAFVQAEVQSIADKLDALLNSLRAANHIA